ncbi:septal ring lytic transglycosylase RlpA family protein [Calothrix sp. UHCC 0171]|uniref:septal ring lytic transglycosylase RlpA family protein n=1 Tax=Calothrix sp. UHCC 0171 TaxID=3110245 RepID=UPI002B208804|nr:septal ring lytic transglycosylase RlpA family protein [Calothrix sp. UHCC 0171]MEA5570625.1 septal ring lytic transglycosylase RlpA family protein [Calothrix sp. UHCC 0171]
MLTFTTFFATSWASFLLSLTQGLHPSNPVKFSTANSSFKLSSSLAEFANRSSYLRILPKRQMPKIQATILPNRFFDIDWDSNESAAKTTQIPNQVQEVPTAKNQFCSTLANNSSESKTTPNISFVPSSNYLSSDVENNFSHSFSNRILRSLQNFFRLPSPFESRFTSSPSPVILVRRNETNYEIWVNKHLLGTVPKQSKAKEIQQRLIRLLKSPNLDPLQLRPSLVDGKPALMLGNRFLFAISPEMTQNTTRSGDLIAIDWVNNLRSSLNVPTLSLIEGQLEMYGLQESNQKMAGLASWYGDYFHGRTTANGEIYNQYALTVAHKSLPFNTFLQVKNVKNGKAVIVRVNDRGPYIPPRSLDLSRTAVRCLDGEIAGVVTYEAKILQPSQPQMTLNAALAEKDRKNPRQMAVISDF